MDKEDQRLYNVNEVSEARLWKTLDSISDRLTGIEHQLSEVVRLEERVNNHEQALRRYGDRLDSHDQRIRESELWQANHGDRSSIERLVVNIQKKVDELEENQKTLVNSEHRYTGQKDVGKEVLKWVCGILAALLIWKFKGN